MTPPCKENGVWSARKHLKIQPVLSHGWWQGAEMLYGKLTHTDSETGNLDGAGLPEELLFA